MLHAAVFDGAIQNMCLVQPFISFADIALSHEYSATFIPSTVAGAIEKYDLADLMASFCPRKLLIINPQASNEILAGENEVNGLLAFPKDVYRRKGVDENFIYFSEKDGPSTHEIIIEWLK